jgi:hypothetical protein
MMTKTTGPGGARPRAGRKTELGGTPTRRVQMTLDARTVELLAVLGQGNVSRGVRHAARVAYDRYQRD